MSAALFVKVDGLERRVAELEARLEDEIRLRKAGDQARKREVVLVRQGEPTSSIAAIKILRRPWTLRQLGIGSDPDAEAST